MVRRYRWPVGLVGLFAAAAAAVGFGPPPAAAAEAQVALRNNQYVPKTVTVKAGDTVVWTDEDVSPHSVTADDGSFDSHPGCTGPANCMKLNDTFRHTFTAPGTYRYYCRIHGGPGGKGMAGTVVVTGSAVTTTSTTSKATSTAKGTSTTTRSRTSTTRTVRTPAGGASTTVGADTIPPITLPADSSASVTDPLAPAPITAAPSQGSTGPAVVVRSEGPDRPVVPGALAAAALTAVSVATWAVARRSRPRF